MLILPDQIGTYDIDQYSHSAFEQSGNIILCRMKNILRCPKCTSNLMVAGREILGNGRVNAQSRPYIRLVQEIPYKPVRTFQYDFVKNWS